ncbi:MAG: hypothetical protein Q9186_006490 [Xanthomendoza sp. 1 TL-2023]
MQRIVTNIEEFTLTNNESLQPLVNEGESYKTLSLTGPTTYTTSVTHALSTWSKCIIGLFPDPRQPAPICNSKPLINSQAILPTGSARMAEARCNALYSNSSLTGPVSTVNAEGLAFISPSIYVAFRDVSAGDACGAVGEKYTSVTLGFTPGVLQIVTSWPESTPTDDPSGYPTACRNLDPKWKSCVVDAYEGIDPPRQLVPASGFEDYPVVTTSVAPVQQPTPAAGTHPLPKETGGGDVGDLEDPSADAQLEPPSNQKDTSKQPDSPALDPPAPDAPDHREPDNSGRKPAEGNKSVPTPPKQPNAQSPEKHPSQNPNSGVLTVFQQTFLNSSLLPNPPNKDIIVHGHTIKQGSPPITIGGKLVL